MLIDFRAGLTLSVALTVAAAALAQEVAVPDRDPPAGEPTMLAVAGNLYLLGLTTKDALTVVTAARLAASVAPQSVVQGTVPTDAGLDPTAMLAQARELSVGDAVLLALIDAAVRDTAPRTVLATRPVLPEKPNTSQIDQLADPYSAGGAVAKIVLARQVFAIGTGDPMMLTTAARLAISVDLVAVDRSPQTSGKAGSEPKAPAAAFPSDGVRYSAVARGAPDPGDDLAIVLDGMEAEAGRIHRARANATASQLAAGQADTWRIALYGSALAELAVLADGHAELRLTVTDDTKSTVCQTDAIPAYCAFAPAKNGHFSVTVSNRGTATANYWLISN